MTDELPPVVLDGIVVGQFLERLSMIEHQLGQITDHLSIEPERDDSDA